MCFQALRQQRSFVFDQDVFAECNTIRRVATASFVEGYHFMSKYSPSGLRQTRQRKSPHRKYSDSHLGEEQVEGVMLPSSSAPTFSSQQHSLPNSPLQSRTLKSSRSPVFDQDGSEMTLLNGGRDVDVDHFSRTHDEYQVKKPISRDDKQGMVLLCILCTDPPVIVILAHIFSRFNTGSSCEHYYPPRLLFIFPHSYNR